ncbi:MAG: transposase, partial [Nitrospirae bacterium]|nr:transposase [Nitrospirota bacterium]
MWAWVFVGKALVFVHIDSSRGRKVLKDILGESFSGIIISDYYNVYRNYSKKWQTCLAHIIRKAKGLIEDDDKLVQAVGYLLKRELKLMISLWRKGWNKTPEMDECKARLKSICIYNKDNDNKQVRNLCKLILDGWEAVVYFTEVEGIEPTNNIAERFLRLLVISRKINFGSQSDGGVKTTAYLRTVAATCKIRK